MTPITCALLDHGYTTQESAPCCHMHISNDEVDSKHYIEIKQSMDNGVWHPKCHRCRIVEETTSTEIKSKRQCTNDYFRQYLDPADNVGLVDLTLAPGFMCNLQCRSCTPYLSSSWIKEELAMPLEIAQSKYAFRDQQARDTLKYNYADDDWSTVRFANFLGGEPLYNPEFYVQLEKLFNDTNGNCMLSITTNGTVRLDLKKYHWLGKFKTLNLCFSIDSTGRSFEFIRTGGIWDNVVKNIQFYKSMDFSSNGCTVGISSHLTASILNILEINNTLDYLESMDIPVTTTQLTEPKHLTYSVLTDQEKQKIIEKIDGTKAGYLVPYMLTEQHNPTNRKNFLLYMEHTKNYHDLDWKDYLPDLYNIMNTA